jgi:2-dehydropantoate 2-reductase
VSRSPIGVLLEQMETRELLTEAAQEVYHLGRALGIPLPDDSVAKTMETLEGITPNSTTSMQRDLVRGKPSELDALIGAVVRLAYEAGIDTPINRFMLYSLRSLELRARGALNFNRRSRQR